MLFRIIFWKLVTIILIKHIQYSNVDLLPISPFFMWFHRLSDQRACLILSNSSYKTVSKFSGKPFHWNFQNWLLFGVVIIKKVPVSTANFKFIHWYFSSLTAKVLKRTICDQVFMPISTYNRLKRKENLNIFYYTYNFIISISA